MAWIDVITSKDVMSSEVVALMTDNGDGTYTTTGTLTHLGSITFSVMSIKQGIVATFIYNDDPSGLIYDYHALRYIFPFILSN